MNQEDRELEQLISDYGEVMQSIDYEQNMQLSAQKKQTAVKRIIDNKKQELLLKIKEAQEVNAMILSSFIDEKRAKEGEFTEEEQIVLNELKNADAISFDADKNFHLMKISENREVTRKTYNYDSFSPRVKKIISYARILNNSSEIVNLKNAFVRVDSEEAKNHVSKALDDLESKFRKINRNINPELLDDIIYNIDTFKERIYENGVSVYEGNINGKTIRVSDDEDIYDALDVVVTGYNMDGVGFGGSDPAAIDYSKPNDTIQFETKKIDSDEPIKAEGAKPIQAHEKDVKDMHAQATKTVSDKELLEQKVDDKEKTDEKEIIKVEGANNLAATKAGKNALDQSNAEDLNKKIEDNNVEFKPEETVKKRKTALDYVEERDNIKKEVKREKSENERNARKKYLLEKANSSFNFAPIAYLTYKGTTIKNSIGSFIKEKKGIAKSHSEEKLKKMWRRSSLNQKIGEYQEKKKNDERLLASMDDEIEKEEEASTLEEKENNAEETITEKVEETVKNEDSKEQETDTSETTDEASKDEEVEKTEEKTPLTADAQNTVFKNYILNEIEKKGLQGQALEDELKKVGLTMDEFTSYCANNPKKEETTQQKQTAPISSHKLEQQKEQEKELSKEIEAIELNPEDMKDDNFDKKKEALKAIRDEIANHPATILENLEKEQQQLEKEISLVELNPEDMWTPEIDDKKQRLAEVNDEISKNPYQVHETNKQEYNELKNRIDAVELNPEDNMYPEFEQDKQRLAEIENDLNNDFITKEQQQLNEYQILKDKVESVEYNPEDNMYPEYMQDKAQLDALEAEFNMGKSR